MTPETLAPGSRLGRFKVKELLGRGGMGAVYRAEDEKGAPVAIKVIARDLATDERLLARFRREASAVAALRHPGIVEIRSVEDADGVPFLVLELVTGGTLRDRLGKGPLPWKEAASLGAGVASALAAVHAAGLVHRDVKPENVLLDASGRPKLSDFGVVGVARGSPLGLARSLTKTGEILGTLDYMAPEQADGKISLGPSVDLYSLGALLYALIAGRPPFQGTGIELVKKHAVDPPPPLRELAPDVPAPLERLVLALLEKEPAKRPASAEQVSRELAAIAGESARPPEAPRRGLPVALGALVLAAAIAAPAIGIGALRGREERAREQEKAARHDEACRLCASATELKRRKQLEQALASASRAIELEPDLALAWERRAAVRYESHDIEGAIADATRAVELAPSLEPAWTILAICRAPRDPDRAIADALRATGADPKSAWAWAALAGAHGRKGDLERTIATATRAIELDRNLALGWAYRGIAKFRMGDAAGTISDLTRAIALDSHDEEALLCRATSRLSQGDVAGALSDVNRAIELEPQDRRALTLRSRARLRIPDADGAIKDASRAIEIDGNDSSGWIARAEAHLKKGDLESALADADKAVLVEPANDETWLARTVVRRKQGDQPGMVQDWTRACALAPKNAKRWAHRAAIHLEVGELAAAVQAATRSIELEPDDPSPWPVRAKARRKTGDRDGAIADAERSLALAPDGADAASMKTLLEDLR